MNLKKTTLVLGVILGFGAIVLMTPSCKKSSSTPAPTLYDSLGGTAKVADPDPANAGQMIEAGRLGIRQVVDTAIFIIAGDTAINSYFSVLLSEVGSGNFSGYQALSKNLTDFICVATGARDFSYTGKSMTDAHNPGTNPRINQKVASDDFDEFVKDVAASATKLKIPSNLIGRLGTLLYSVESQVVQR